MTVNCCTARCNSSMGWDGDAYRTCLCMGVEGREGREVLPVAHMIGCVDLTQLTCIHFMQFQQHLLNKHRTTQQRLAVPQRAACNVQHAMCIVQRAACCAHDRLT